LLAGKLIVEANTYGNMTFTNPEHYNPGACEASAEGCMLWKQVTSDSSTQFTCFTGTKVQILTQLGAAVKAEPALASRLAHQDVHGAWLGK